MKLVGLRACVTVILIGASAALAAQAHVLDEARSLIRQGRHDAALARIETRLATVPDDPEARFLKGVALAEAGRRSAAIDAFSGLTKDYPRMPEPHNNLAVLFAAQGELEEAQASLLDAIRIHPNYATAHENLGDVYGKLAALAYARAVELDGGNEAARIKLSRVNELAARAAVRTAAPPAAAGVEQEVMAAVDAWARAWSSQNVKTYLGHYADAFRPADGRSKSNWTILRRKRVGRPQFIRLQIDAPRVTVTDDNRASVVFEQTYRSDTYADQVTKRLDLVRQDGEWKIVSERTVD